MISWLMDDVLGFDAPKTTQTQSQSGSNTYNSWVTDASRSLVGRANEMKQPEQYKGQLSRGLTGTHSDVTKAIGGMVNTPLSAIAGNAYNPTSAQGFVDQYIKASAPALSAIETGRAQAVNAAGDRAGTAFGGSRSAIAEGMANRNADLARSSVLSNAINQGVGMGFNAHQANIGNRLNAYNSRLGAIGAGLGVGNATHGILQGDLDRARSEHYRGQDLGINRLTQIASILGAVPKDRFTSGTSSGTMSKDTDWASLLTQGASMAAGLAM